MADQKLTERPATTTLDDADLVHVVTDVAGTPTTKKITVANLRTEMQEGGGSYPGVTTGGTGSLDMAQGTKTTNEPFIDASVTWNAAGVTFFGIDLNAIETAAAAASKLLRLRKSGSIMFEVSKDGKLSMPESGSTVTIAQNGDYRWSSGGRIAWGTNGIKIQDSVGNPATIEFTAASPASMATTVNNYDWGSGAYFLRLTANAANTVMTGGRGGGQSGEVHLIVNIAAAGTLTLSHESASSNAAQRFLNSTGADIVLSPNQAADLIYDSTVSRYRVFKRS